MRGAIVRAKYLLNIVVASLPQRLSPVRQQRIKTDDFEAVTVTRETE